MVWFEMLQTYLVDPVATIELARVCMKFHVQTCELYMQTQKKTKTIQKEDRPSRVPARKKRISCKEMNK